MNHASRTAGLRPAPLELAFALILCIVVYETIKSRECAL